MWSDENLINILRGGGVAVMPTDTLYGIVGSALNQEAVERIYKIRKRNPEKPCIILLSDWAELEKFNISLTKEQENKIKESSSGPTSFILDCAEEKFAYLHRGTQTLAFRVPENLDLQELLQKTGPLIAPSANIEGENPSKNIEEAKKYFGDLVDTYADGGTIEGQPSKVIRLYKNGDISIMRK